MNYTIDIDKFEAAEGEYLRFVEVPELLVKGFKWDEESGKMIDAMEPLLLHFATFTPSYNFDVYPHVEIPEDQRKPEFFGGMGEGSKCDTWFDAIHMSLYDAYQVHDEIKKGDTFTVSYKGETKVFRCIPIHVIMDKRTFDDMPDVFEMRGDEYALERNDCTVTAIATLAVMPYGAAHRELELAGRKPKHGWFIHKFLQFKNYRVANYQVTQVPLLMESTNTVNQIKKNYRVGRYLVKTKGHVFALVNGKQIDPAMTGPRARVHALYKFEAI